VFRTWPDDLPTTVEVCPVQLPGRGNRLHEVPYTQLSPLVQAIAKALLPYLDKPFAVFGHCVGALVSFELARQLRRQYGLSPAYLCVSACGAPQIPDPSPPLHALPEAAFLEELRRRGRMAMRLLEAPEMMQLLLPILRADFVIYETYTYASEAPLDCPISAFGGLQDHTVSHERLDAWRAQTSASFRQHMLPGDHFFLHTAQPLVLRTLSRELNQLVTLAT
jgi:medium-chain acyl-[acyl-carrier-protein] hydrolase